MDAERQRRTIVGRTMTLILSCVTRDHIIQVSDRKVSDLATGAVVNDLTAKTYRVGEIRS